VSLLMTLSDLRPHAAHPVLDTMVASTVRTTVHFLTFSEKTRYRRSLKIRNQNWEERKTL